MRRLGWLLPQGWLLAAWLFDWPDWKSTHALVWQAPLVRRSQPWDDHHDWKRWAKLEQTPYQESNNNDTGEPMHTSRLDDNQQDLTDRFKYKVRKEERNE